MSWGEKIGIFGCLLIIFIFFAGVPMALGLFVGKSGGSANGPGYTDPGDLGNTEVPEVLKPIFNAAAQKHQISPAFLAAIFWKEHGGSWQTEGPWATSKAGANGPFQFIEKTWEGWSAPGNSNGIFERQPSIIAMNGGYGQDGTGDYVADVQDLTDSAFAAADLLGSNGAAPNTTDIEKLKDVASMYNYGRGWELGQKIPETAAYVPAVITAYERFLSQM